MKRILSISALAAAVTMLFPSCEKDSGLVESQLIYFGITEPYTRIGGIAFTVDNTTMTITNDEPVPANIDLSSVKPYFITNHESKGVFVKGVEQLSGVSKQDLSAPVKYEVVSERETLVYDVIVTKSEDIKTQAGVKLSGLSDLVAGIGEETEMWIADGLRFSETEFTTTDGRSLKMDLFEADLSRDDLYLYPLTAGNFNDPLPETEEWPVQTITEMAGAAGIEVLGAISGDFFEASGVIIPEGPVCRNGKWLKESFHSEKANRYFGIRKDGRASLGGISAMLSLMDNMTFAIGGKEYLLTEDAPADEIKSRSDLDSRTGIGTNRLDHKMVYIVTITGDEGVTLAETAQIMKAFGTSEAINLAGGDNTSFVIREGSSLKAKNRPEEQMKKVPDGVAIVKR